jgi:hypothetical protein
MKPTLLLLISAAVLCAQSGNPVIDGLFNAAQLARQIRQAEATRAYTERIRVETERLRLEIQRLRAQAVDYAALAKEHGGTPIASAEVSVQDRNDEIAGLVDALCDPPFRNLPIATQLRLLARVSPDFGAMELAEQIKLLDDPRFQPDRCVALAPQRPQTIQQPSLADRIGKLREQNALEGIRDELEMLNLQQMGAADEARFRQFLDLDRYRRSVSDPFQWLPRLYKVDRFGQMYTLWDLTPPRQ